MVCKIRKMLQQEWSLSMQTHIRRQVFMQFVHLRTPRSFLDILGHIGRGSISNIQKE